jgi:hypothetical protein
VFDLFHSWFDKALLSVVEGLTTNGINQLYSVRDCRSGARALTRVTRNLREFQRVDGLRSENWKTDA